MLHRALRILILMITAVSALNVPTASAVLPGANGPLSVPYSGPTLNDRLRYAWYDTTTGGEARPDVKIINQASSTEQRARGPIFKGTDGRIAVNAFDPINTYLGIYVGDAANPASALLSSSHAAPPPPTGEWCIKQPRVIAQLADDTLLWQRTYWKFDVCATQNVETEKYIGYTVTRMDASAPRLVTEVRGNSFIADPLPGIFATGADPNTAYGCTTAKVPSEAFSLYRANLTTGARTIIGPVNSCQSGTFAPTDITPDGMHIFGTGNNGEIRRFDVDSQSFTTILSGSALRAVAPVTGGDEGLISPGIVRISPDVTKIAIVRKNTNDGPRYPDKFDSIIVADITGANAHTIASFDPMVQILSADVVWLGEAGLNMKLDGGPLAGSLAELDLTLTNPSDAALNGMTFGSLVQTSGIELDSSVYPIEDRAQVSLLAGPTPKLPATLAAGGAVQMQYLLGVDTPGKTQIRSEAQAVNAQGKTSMSTRTVTLTATDRSLDRTEQAATVIGGWSQVQQAGNDRMKRLMSGIDRMMKQQLRGSQRHATPLERSLALRLGLSEDALAWLPENPKQRTKAIIAFTKAKESASIAYMRKQLGGSFNAKQQNDYVRFADHITADPASSIPVGEAVFSFGDRALSSGVTTDGMAELLAGSFEKEHPQQAFHSSIDEVISKIGVLKTSTPRMSAKQTKQFKQRLVSDPEFAAKLLGLVYGKAQGKVAYELASETFSPKRSDIIGGLKGVSINLKAFKHDEGDAGQMFDGLREFVKPMRVPLAAAQKEGMTDQLHNLLRGIGGKVEDAPTEYGFSAAKSDTYLRRSNPFSANLSKIGVAHPPLPNLITGNEVDILLGMDARALGKLVAYKPVKPAGMKALPPDLVQQLNDRYSEANGAHKSFMSLKGLLNRATKKSGVTVTQNKTRTSLTLQAVGFSNTTMFKLRHLVTGGRTIVSANKPKWGISGFDNRIQIKPRNTSLFPRIAQLLGVEAMIQQRSSGVAVSVGNVKENGAGIVPGSAYRNMFRFMVSGMSTKDANRAMAKYLKKYTADSGAYEQFLKTYSLNDYDITITSADMS